MPYEPSEPQSVIGWWGDESGPGLTADAFEPGVTMGAFEDQQR